LVSMIWGGVRPEDARSGPPGGPHRGVQGKPVNQSRRAGVRSPWDQEQL
jgi:hypothetical protein